MPGPILPIAAGIAARAIAKKAATKAAGKATKKVVANTAKKAVSKPKSSPKKNDYKWVEDLLKKLGKAEEMTPKEIARFNQQIDKFVTAEKAGKVSKIKKK
jgi:hypothetical protein